MGRRLRSEEIVEAADRYASGETLQSIADDFGVTLQAIWPWVKNRSMGVNGFRELRSLRHANKILNNRLKRNERFRKAAATVIRLLQPSPKRRSLIVPLIRARYGFGHRDANRLVAISAKAGQRAATARVDRALVAAMKHYLDAHPAAGFPQLFSVIRKETPGTRGRALDIYTNYFASRAERLDRVAKVGPRRRMPVQNAPDLVWSMDFMQGALPSGARFWVLAVIDDFNKEALACSALKRRSASAVVKALSDLFGHGRKPIEIRSDRGSEFKSKLYRERMRRTGVRCIYSRPRTPSDNRHVEFFNALLRHEVLLRFSYDTLERAQNSIDDWVLHYNYARPQEGLRGLSPKQYSAWHCHPR